MYKIFITINQFLCYFFLAIPLRILYRADRYIPLNIDQLRRGSLVVSNHRSVIDPFVVLAFLPFSVFLRIIPICFPVCDRFMNNIFLSPILKILGSFNIGKTARENMIALFRIRHLLQQKQTVFLFPEGKVCKRENIGEFKKGIEFLLAESQNVVFVRMRGSHSILERLTRKPFIMRFSDVYELRDPRINSDKLEAMLEKL